MQFIVYMFGKYLPADRLRTPTFGGCRMTTFFRPSWCRMGCATLYNPLHFVLKPGLHSLTDMTVNIESKICMHLYLCEICTNCVVLVIHCCCDVFSDGFHHFLTVSAGCLAFCKDPGFSSINENLFDTIFDPGLRHYVNMGIS